jgi:hypothetical protein
MCSASSISLSLSLWVLSAFFYLQEESVFDIHSMDESTGVDMDEVLDALNEVEPFLLPSLFLSF